MKYEEEYQKKNEEAQKEILYDYMKSSKESHKNAKKKFFIISLIVVAIILVIKVFWGTIELYNVLGYPPSKSRYYKVTVNNKQVAVSAQIRQKIPLIPYLINFNSYYTASSNISNDDTGPFFYADDSKNYYINISSYKCYYNNTQVECKNNEQTMKKTDDEKYEKMVITRTSYPYEVVYDGEFTSDIAPYVSKKGSYCVEIYARDGLTTTKIYFYFEN